MRLLVTGGSGFLGGHVLAEAARRGHETAALARSQRAARIVETLGAAPLPGDLDDPERLDEAFAAARCEVLVSLSSLGFGHAPAVIAAAAEAGIRRAVFVSTTAVTTALDPPAKRIRLEAERQIRTSGLDWTILRPTMIYGTAGDRNLSRVLALLTRAPLLPAPGADRLHQPAHVADVADAVLAAVERPGSAGASYDIAGPAPLTFLSLLRACAEAVGSHTRFVPAPLGPLVAVARGYEAVSRRPRIKAEQVLRLGEDKAFPIEKASRYLGYAPRPFREGIRAEARAMGLAP